MKRLVQVLSLSALLLAGLMPAAGAANLPAGAALPDRLGDLLRDLDQEQALRLTRSAGDREARFSAAPPDQILQALSTQGQTALVLLASRGARKDAPLTLQRALRVSGVPARAGLPTVKAAYVLNDPADADLSALLGQVLMPNRIGSTSASPALESISAADAIAAINGWKGVRFVAGLEPAAGSSTAVLKDLYLVPDTIRISITGDRLATPATVAQSNTGFPEKTSASSIPVAAAAATESRSPTSLPSPQRASIEPDLQQHRQQMEQERAEREQQERERMKQEQAQWRETESKRVEQEQIEREQSDREEMEQERLARARD